MSAARPAEDLIRKRDNVWAKRGMAPQFAPPPEVVEKRTEFGKTWDLGGGTYHMSTSIGPVHYKDEQGRWQEIDLTLKAVETEGGLIYRMDKAAYTVEIMPDRVAWRYMSRAGGFLDMELLTVNGEPVDYSQMRHRVDGNVLFWNDVAPGVDIKLCLYRKKVEDFKRFDAPTKLTWRVYRSPDFGGEFQEKLAGWEPKSMDRLEILSALDGERFTEEWTGRVSRVVDKRTRRKAWADDAQVPVIVDAAISEGVTANADDGYNFAGSGSWLYGVSAWRGGRNGGSVFGGGVRWQSLALPAGATTSVITITLNVTSLTGTPNTRLYADDVDDAAPWAYGNVPTGITKTTAYIAVNPVATGAGQTFGATGPLGEVFSRAGWGSGNDVRIGIIDQATAGNHFFAAEDYQAAGTNEAQLDATYTVAATGSNQGGRVTLLGGR